MGEPLPADAGDVPPDRLLSQQWREGRQGDLVEFVRQFPAMAAGDLLAVLLVDQHERRRVGERIPLEAYLRRFPVIEADPEAVVELAYAEWLSREAAGERPALAEFEWRFPTLAMRLRQQIDLGRALDAPADPPSPPLEMSNPTEPATREPAGVPAVPGYEILGVLGRGGMGIVYKARHAALRRVVALKMILGGDRTHENELSRFRTEAEAIARLQHPNIVQVFEVGEHAGVPYLSLEFCPRGSLDKTLAGTPMAPADAARLVGLLARAMHAAHQKGVIHRDLKPANVLLAEDGMPKISDFGLAKKSGDDGPTPQTPADLTETGVIMGTPSYMAPEQAEGKGRGIGPACDVHALGVVLYECLTGRPPFKAATPLDTLLQVVNEEPWPPGRLNARVTRDLETICLECLHKSPSRRYASAAALADDLDRFLSGVPIRARPVHAGERLWRWATRNPRLAGLSATVVLLTIILTAGSVVAALTFREERRTALDHLGRAEQAEREGREKVWEASLAQARAGRFSRKAGQRFDSLAALLRAAEIRPAPELRDEMIACLALADIVPSPPGERPAEVQNEWSPYDTRVEGGDLVVMRATDGHPLARLGSKYRKVEHVMLGPDGRFLAVWYRGAAPAGGPGISRVAPVVVWDWRKEKRLVETDWLRLDSWNPPEYGFAAGGTWFYSTDRANVARVYDLEAGRTLLERALSPTRTIHWALHPDGRRLAASGVDDPRVRLVDLGTGRLELDLPFPPGVVRLAWHPDGRRLAVGTNRRTVQVWDTVGGTLSAPVSVDAHYGLGWSAGGEWLVANGWRAKTELIDAAAMEVAVGINGGSDPPVLDGDRFLKGGPAGFFRVALPRECRTLDVRERDFCEPAAFSPDGRWPALAGPDGVALHQLTACGPPEMLPVGPCDVAMFHASGDLLTYGSRRGLERWPIRRAGEPNVWRVGPPVDLGVRPRSRQWNWGAVGRDGRVVVSDWSANQVILLDPDRPKQRRVFGHLKPRCVSISPDGGRVAAGTWNGERSAVWDAATGAAKLLPPVSTHSSQHVTFSADGRHLVLSEFARYDFHRVGTWEKESTRPRVQPNLPVAPAYSPDGRIVAVSDSPNDVRLLRASDGKDLGLVQWRFDDTLMAVRLSPDGRYLVTALGRRTLLWDLALIRECLEVPGLADGWPRFVETPDSRTTPPTAFRLIVDATRAK